VYQFEVDKTWHQDKEQIVNPLQKKLILAALLSIIQQLGSFPLPLQS
jgi:hypothetical protein